MKPRSLRARLFAAIALDALLSLALALVLGAILTRRAVERNTLRDVSAQFDLLAYLLENAGIVVSRDQLLDQVWGMSYAGGTRTVDVHVAQVRRKLGRPDSIRTVRGSGYKAVKP